MPFSRIKHFHVEALLENRDVLFVKYINPHRSYLRILRGAMGVAFSS